MLRPHGEALPTSPCFSTGATESGLPHRSPVGFRRATGVPPPFPPVATWPSTAATVDKRCCQNPREGRGDMRLWTLANVSPPFRTDPCDIAPLQAPEAQNSPRRTHYSQPLFRRA